MKKRSLKYFYILIIALIASTAYLVLTNIPDLPGSKDEYIYDNGFIFINTSSSVKYVGTEACKSCHKTSHRNFTHTEMHRSFEILDTTNIIESYPQETPVYDAETGYYYEMLKKNNRFFQREFRLDSKGKLVYERLVEAQYTIGSGNNLRMYFYEKNGMLYQHPLTWYTFKQKWDLSPGYRETGNLRFNRYATKKCIGCHNSYMDETETAIDRFKKPFTIGIGCERCHGPGEYHIKEMNVDNNYSLPDKYKSIVNPARLSQKRSISICMQCHLMGKAWAYNDIDTWFDFRPGQLLETNRSVYFPLKTSKEQIEVGDSPHRLSLSKCFKESGDRLTCVTCHDPHYSINSFTIQHYNDKCINCHLIKNLKQNSLHNHDKADNCVSCHMKRTGKENTLHGVSLTDHWIRVDAYKTKIDWSKLRQPADESPLVQLFPDVDANDGNRNLRRGMGYLDYYLEYDRSKSYLDSALFYLQKDKDIIKKNALENFSLGEVYIELNEINRAIEAYKDAIELNPDYEDAYFKLGKAYTIKGDYDTATDFFRKAVDIKPGEPPFLENLGTSLVETGNIDEAVYFLKKAISIDSQNAKTFYTLGYVYAINLNEPIEAIGFFKKSVSLDPLIEDGYLNLGNTYALLNKYDEALSAYEKQIVFTPSSASAYINSGRIYQVLGKKPHARKMYQKALKIEPRLAIAKKLLEEL